MEKSVFYNKTKTLMYPPEKAEVSTSNLPTYFNTAMANNFMSATNPRRIPKRVDRGNQGTQTVDVTSPRVFASRHHTMPDVEMKSVGSCKYDPGDFNNRR